MASKRIDKINRKNNFLPGLTLPEEDDVDEFSKDSFQMTDFKERPINGEVNPAYVDDESNGTESDNTDEDDDVFESVSTQGDVINSTQQPNGDIRKRRSTKKKEKENHLWDVFRVTSEDNISESDLAIWRTVFIITKIIFVFLFFLVVLTTAVVTKITFLIMTSNIYVPAKIKPDNTTDGIYKFKELGGRLDYKEADGEARIETTWIWALITVMSAPYFFTICKCLWRLCFNKTRPLKVIPLLVALITETLHSFGLFILMVVILPQFEPLASAFAILPVATIPSLLKIKYPERTMKKAGGKMLVARLMNTIAFVLCVGSIACFCFYICLSNGSTLLLVLTAVCPVFISLSWWENFARQGDKESIGIPKLKRKLRQCKTKISILTNLWKLILNYGVLPSLVFGANCAEGTKCIHIFFLQFETSEDTFKSNTYLYPENAVLSDFRPYKNCITYLPFFIALGNIASSVICFKVGKAACKILAQRMAFSLPLVLSTPVTISIVLGFYSQSSVLNFNGCYSPLPAWDGDATTIVDIVSWYWPVLAGGIAAFFSLLLITNHIWSPGKERLVSTDKLFVQPLYCGVLLDQSMMLNRRRVDDEFKSMDEKNTSNIDIPIPDLPDLPTDNPNWNPNEDWSILRKDDTPMIYMCATMWHETELEMTQILKSIFRMDEDQCARRNLQMFLGIKDPDYYEFEVHIFFDDAFEKHNDDEYEYRVNNYVKMLVRVIDLAATSVHNTLMKIPPPTKIPTPYGGRLIWRLPGGNKIIAHLKDKMKIRHRKRWSQVMYMYYFLGYKLISMKMSRKRKKVISENTFLLALDGDVDFQPSAVQLLVDRMKKNPKLGATCGRIHPIGSGPMVWYQKFEYAISHWLQKATEHTLGCVLCSPGCFSLFRGYALMDDNVMRRYTTPPSEPSHYVQYDQGEDRWLCTLLLQQGYRVEYVAASDALTYAPEGFNEFYNQRRRWSPSTMANILDLLMDWKNVRRKNDDISLPYIGYQMFLMVSSILTPGTIFLMILGALTTGFPGIQPWTALLVNLVPVVIFVLMCFVAKPDVQLTYAAILSVIYSLVMMVVLVGLLREAATAGFCSVTTIFLCFVAGVFVLSAFLHPQEFFCIIHGFLYFLSIPSMSMLLMIYSLGNLHVVSWGTRETTQPTTSATQQKVSQKKGMVQGWLERFGMAEVGAKQDSDYNFSCGNLFRCMCCPQQSSSNHDNHLAVILERLNDIEERMTEYTRSQVSRNLSAGSSVINETQVEDHKPFSQNALLFEGEGERANPLFQEEKQKKRDELKDPYWIHDEDIKSGATVYLPNDEVDFWNQFIGDYLFPIVEDKKQKKEIEKGLLELRNKVCLAFLLINAMFVTIVYALTQINVSDNNSLSVPLWCKSGKGDGHKQATVEPISFAFTAVFGILLLIQFICMLFHRTATLLHILASTEIGVKKRFDKMRKSPEEADDIADITVADGLKLVRDMQASNDDDSDTKSVMSIATTIASEDDAGDTIETKNKSDLWKKIARRRKELGHNTLSKNFLKNFSKLHQVIHEDDDASTRGMSGSEERNEAEDNIKKVQNKFGKRFQRQSLYTIVNMAKNPHLKQRISERAERVSRWKDLQKKLIPNPAQKGFAGIAKLALQKDKEEKIKQQQQQQTVDEQKEQPKVTTEVDINPQLPDRGEEWPEEDNYAIAGGDYEEINDIKTKDLNNSDVLF